MRRRGLWLAAAIVLVSNLAAWGAAARNRAGEADSVLVLTERELALPAKQAENTAMTLSIVFAPLRARGEADRSRPGWFDRAKLESIGFDCGRPVIAENASYFRARPPRQTYVALEFEGEAWRRQIEDATRAGAETEAVAAAPGSGGAQRSGDARRTPRDPLLESHLVPIDVDNDRAALRRRHPDRQRVAVVEGTAALVFVNQPGRPPFLAGRVTSVLPGDISVPREWRGLLESLQSEPETGAWPPPQHQPRFRATVTWGTRLEPWVTNVELVNPEPAR